MQEQTNSSWHLQLVLKITAIFCGGVLLLASAKHGSEPLNLSATMEFIADQLRSASQLKWLFGIIFLLFGIFFMPVKKKIPRSFAGSKDLKNDSYILYLVDKYQIERNTVLNQLTVQNRIFSHRDGAIQYAHELECPTYKEPVFTESITVQEEVVSSAFDAAAMDQETVKPETKEPVVEGLNTAAAYEAAAAAFARVDTGSRELRGAGFLSNLVHTGEHVKLTVALGVVLFSVVLGGLYYANSHSKFNREAPVVTKAPVEQVVESSAQAAPSSDQASNGATSAAGTTPATTATATATDSQEVAKTVITPPINERWIGLWISELGGKQKLAISPTAIKFGDEEFVWSGLRPKGVIVCCPAFYEGTITKSDLLARIPGANDLSTPLKPDTQKTLAMVQAMGEGNFRKIVLADPFLKKYFFIYDQNLVYRINRDLGDKADLVIEPFKKKE